MATYRITYKSADPYHEMNGDCGTVDSGAAFIALWPDVEPEAGDTHDTARLVDELEIGYSVAFYEECATIDVERIA